MSANLTPRAYVLFDRSDDDHGQIVVYARTAREARGSGYDDVAYIDTGARRAPEFDRFAEAGGPTLADLLEAGWYQECGSCCRNVRSYDLAIHDDGSGTARGIVTESDAYCSPECEARDVGRMRGYRFHNAEIDAVRTEARRRWPDADVHANWNVTGYREPPPAEGFRVWVRLYWKRPSADVYATWWYGDANHEGEEVHERERRSA